MSTENKTSVETASDSPVAHQRLVSCRVCNSPTEPENLTHLKIYVSGSEGVDVCITCRQVLTEVLRGMMRTNIAGRKQGYLACKEVRAAKAANDRISDLTRNE
jgi:hypothetical protein